jgi:hypothetical protein
MDCTGILVVVSQDHETIIDIPFVILDQMAEMW